MEDIQPSTSSTQPSSQPSSSLIHPTDANLASSAQSRPSTSGGSSSRKRKVPDSVTPNACTNCQRARAKCDGAKPACKRCANRTLHDTCHYEVHAKTAKEQMVREIRRLQRKTEYLEEEKDTLGEKNSWIEQIIRSLKDDGQGPEIINRLKRGETHQKIAEWLGRQLLQGREGREPPTLSPTTERSITEAITQYHKNLVENRDSRYWTNVTPEASLIEHLVQLYMTWIHPVHMLFDQSHFMTSYRECSDTYCSSAMVNVVCAMSCNLLHDESLDDDEQTKAGIESMQAKFLDETRLLMRHAEYDKMTTIQTYAIMFLVEVSSGHGLIASSHLRLASETLVAKSNSEQSLESEEVAAWGILTLHTTWSALTYQKPTVPISTRANPFDSITLDQADWPWRFYRHPGDLDIESRPSFSVLTTSRHAKLFRVIHESILVYCGSRGRVSANALLKLYERFLDWKETLPADLANVENEPLPHVLFLHVQYYTALVHLLRPMLHLDQYDQESYEHLRSLLVRYAKAGRDLLDTYSRLYTCHYFSPLQLFCLVHLCDALVRFDAADEVTRNDTVKFCLISLETAKVGYPLAGPLQKMFRLALSDYSVSIPDELERHVATSARIGPEDLLEACTRSSYQQPMAQILPNMQPSAGQDFIHGLQQIFEPQPPEGKSSMASRGKQKRVDIGALLNS